MYDVGPYERATLARGGDLAARVLKAAGASAVAIGRVWPAAHLIGTHRMGRDPATSVLDGDLRAHEVPNLYAVGSGAFVTASASPPTLTIVALAIRTAERIAGELGVAAAPAGARSVGA